MSTSQPLHSIARIHGTLRVPGDKSISHRGLLFGAIAEGTSRLRGLATGADVATSRRVIEALGVETRDVNGEVQVVGRGWAGLDHGSPDPLELDCGNSGTTARLLMGLLSGRSGRYRLTGDESLSLRPMGRVVRPLTALGASVEGDTTLPLVVGGGELQGAELTTEVPSAQVKSAILLAALQGSGETLVEEARLSRDHTERLLGAQGATIESLAPTQWKVRGGSPVLAPLDLDVPGDPSSAAYAVALACCLPNSEVVAEGLSLNPTRLGFYALLRRMGASVEWAASGDGPEPRGELTARSSSLHGVELGPDDVVSAIDELPLLAVVAAAAEGTTTIRGAGELRHKETDRIAATAALLRAAGVEHEELEDGLVIHGPTQFRAASFDAMGDHRIAMCATVLAALADGESQLVGGEWVRISYPEFFSDLERLSDA